MRWRRKNIEDVVKERWRTDESYDPSRKYADGTNIDSGMLLAALAMLKGRTYLSYTQMVPKCIEANFQNHKRGNGICLTQMFHP